MRWSRRKRLNRRRAEKARRIRKRILITSAAVLSVAALDVLYIKAMDGRFYHHTTLNGFDVSGYTASQAVDTLSAPYNALSLRIDEQGETVLSVGFADMGCQVNQEELTAAVNELIDRQNPVAYGGLILGKKYGMHIPFQVDEEAFQSAVCAEKLSKPRVSTTDATLVETDGRYTIQPEVYGTDFEDADLRSLVSETITRSLSDEMPGDTVVAELPQSIYRQPEILSDNADLNDQLELYNRFCGAQVTYEFGEQKKVLGWDTIRGWLRSDDPDDPLDEEAVYNYVCDLASVYDTYDLPRTFESTWHGTMTIEYNTYGYQIDIDGEVSQLLSDIHANTAVSREPVYSHVGYSRNGVDDLNGTYVEVDLSNQHLWFYKHGDLVTESDIISGLPTEERETHEGVFTIPYKASPFNLVGQGGAGEGSGWDVEVQYWMPFDDGQGLHDAAWQSNFGGSTYKIAGSHGCINLPIAEAAAIYAEMEDNVCILIYK